MKRAHAIHITVGIVLFLCAFPANAEWYFQSTDASRLRLMEVNPAEGTAILANPAGSNFQAGLGDEIGNDQMRIVDIKPGHIILQKDKNQLRLLRQPGSNIHSAPPAGLMVPPQPPSD